MATPKTTPTIRRAEVSPYWSISHTATGPHTIPPIPAPAVSHPEAKPPLSGKKRTKLAMDAPG